MSTSSFTLPLPIVVSGSVDDNVTNNAGSLLDGQIPIISFSDLTRMIDVIQSREEEDRVKLVQLESISNDVVRENLRNWAMSQFQNNYTFYTIQFNILDTCSDGIVRSNVFDYMTFLKPEFSLVTTLYNLEQRLPGMKLSYSYTNSFTLYIHVSKKE